VLRDAKFDGPHFCELVSRPAFVASVVQRLLLDGYDHFLGIGLGPRPGFSIQQMATALGKEITTTSSLTCLVEGRTPFAQSHPARVAALARRLTRVVWSTRR
jgi:hypothetical protein